MPVLHVTDEFTGESVPVCVEHLAPTVLFVFLIEAAADIDSATHVDLLDAEPPAHAFLPESFVATLVGPGEYTRTVRQFLLIDISGVITDLELHILNQFTVSSLFHQLVLLQAPVIIFIKLFPDLRKGLLDDYTDDLQLVWVLIVGAALPDFR